MHRAKNASKNLIKRISYGENERRRYFVETKVIPQRKIEIEAKKRPAKLIFFDMERVYQKEEELKT